ncbi:MAG: oxaloacetate decarboxylase [Bermanella sp.]|nr:oxaloacetate decarboxylase [Bermanella sp.]|tara:strand:+ start:294 stop:533 length:240 start_codon:yes stop_codon:yes gene_type:complete
MSPIVADGLGLMGFGMGTVFIFLVVLIFATTIMSKLVTKYFPEALPAPAKVKKAPAQGVDPQLLKVLTAAVKEHRSRQK